MNIRNPTPAANGFTDADKDTPMVNFKKLTAAIILASMAGIVSGCGSLKPANDMSTGSIPDDYRTRHPISIAEVRHSLDVPIASGDRKLNIAVHDAIRGFARDYGTTASGTVQMSTPEGGINAGAARHARAEIRQVLIKAGVAPNRLIETTYPVSEANASYPVRLSYVAITAMTDECGEWPSDLGKTEENKNWDNFGCATQKNLAAQIASPMDLVAPRAVTPIDAERRSEVIRVYREGK